MSSITVATTIHICEDTNGTFDLNTLLAAAGHPTGTNPLNIIGMSVTLPDGSTSATDTPLFGKVDSDTIYVRPGQWHTDYNGTFATLEFVVEQGTKGSNAITLKLQVIVDPVNDAPTAANKTFDLSTGAPVALQQADFGFVDAVEHDAFQSVIITSLPSAGKLMLDGVAVAVNTEISAADIAAGKLSFEPSQSASGNFDIGFKVRDAGGMVGCGAADTSATPNYLTFKVPPAHIGDFVWEDVNGNGVQDSGEAGIANVTVQIKDATGHVVGTTTTDASGKYHFDVDAGSYSVTVQAPAGYAVAPKGQGGNTATDSDIGADGSTGAIALKPGETNNSADGGLYRPAALGDTVWYDTNRNGVQDSGEAGVAGVKVTLLDANGSPVSATVTTDASGHYQFSGLKPGSYSVQFDQTTLPSHYLFTGQSQGGDASKDSDADASGNTAQVTLVSGDSQQHLDAGIVVQQATLGDRVWEDANGNGVQDGGELGLDGVTVSLKDAGGNVVGTTTTHDGGQYSFTVDPGTYSVSVTAPAGYVASAAGQGGNAAADSDIDAAGSTGAITLSAAQVKTDIDAGLYRPASLGDTVWLDANRNGVQDAGEAGVAGVKLVLLDASGAPTGAVATTDTSGNYSFTNLKPGTYSVQFDKATLPADTVFTVTGQGTGATDSDADTVSGKSGQVTLSSGDHNTDLDAGIVKVQATVGDRVWEDSNGNGVQDSGEQGVDGVAVSLKDAAGNVVSSVTTHDGGQYSFTVDPGTYTVSVAPPQGFSFTGAGKGGNGALDSDVNGSGDASVTLTAGQNNPDIDAGIYRPASLSQVVWFDADRDGRLDNGEAGAAGVKVILLDANGAPIAGASATTDVNGHYQFTNLAPGNYSVQFDKSSLPAGYDFTTAAQGGPGGSGSDADTGTGKTTQVTLHSGEDMTLRAGLVIQQATLGDRVWLDANGNGLQDAGEAGIVGVTVDLKDENGNVVKTTTTGTDGKYSFTVDPGKYSVSVTAPGGLTATGAHAGADGVDSDIDAAGQSGQVTLTAGQVNNNVDAGFYKGATLGDKVWLDANRNGVQDSGEAGVAGVKVILLDAAGNPTGAAATTDANGVYSFTSLKPGTYSVQFDKATLPANHSFTGADLGGNDAKDSDANVSTGKTAQVTLASGGVNNDLDAGIVADKAKLGDTVWEDKNANGVQDSGEAGIAGVTVQLKDSTGAVVQTTTTGADGKYGFTADAGTYTVSVTAPKDYVFTAKDAGGDDAKDSDFGATGQSNAVTVNPGDNNTSIDAGLYKTASVGDKVWLDTNKNGVQDSGEAGLCGVKVTLLDANGNKVGTSVTTDVNGNYQFTNLKPGSYTVQFDKASLPEGMSFTVANQGSNDAVDSDVNASGLSHSITLTSGQVDKSVDAGVVAAATIGDRVWIDKNGNGMQDDGESGKSGVTVELRDGAGSVVKTTTTDSNGNYKFSVEAGTYSVDIKAPTGFLLTTQKVGSNNAIDSDADASGKLGSVTVSAGQNVTNMDAGLVQKGEIGDKVWCDANGDGIQNNGEGGVTGVKVTLLNEKGVAIATDVTDSNGLYSFTDVGPGKYSVKFGAVAGYAFTRQDQGSNDAADSDADSSGLTAQFTLSSGQVDKTHDAGIVRTGSIGNRVWEDLNANGVQESGEKGVDGVTVKLYDAASGALKGTTVTHDGGQYLFDDLTAGNYKVEVTNSTGWYFTKAGVGSDATDSDITSITGSTGKTGAIALGIGQDITTEDAGIYRKASIGDKVWRDANHNGIQDSGEEGIGGISVTLFDAATNAKLGTVKTDAGGSYKFADLTPGSYYLQFDKTNVSVTFASDHKTYNMSDWKWGVKNVGSNDTIDSDVAGDGKALTNVTKTDTITLTSGKNDMSWDATITPIAIDLNGDGIHTIARENMAGSFDLLGSGKAIQTGWLSSGDGFLAIDSNGNGKIDDISELFGGVSKGSGFAKLASYDSNGDGVVNATDAQFSSLMIWQDANSNGKTDAGELIGLAAAGVVSLKVGYTELPFLDANNNLHLERSSVTLSNGKLADMTDVYFNVAASDAAAAGIATHNLAELIGQNTAVPA